MSDLRIDLTPADDVARVALLGDLTEHADFGVIRAITSPAIVIDLRDVRRINSCGVREWIRLMEALRDAPRAVELERCSVPFVNQMNMIVNFVGGARVRSFYAPYLCGGCDEEFVELCDLPDEGAPALSATARCPRCGGSAEFDDLADTYLAFVRSSRTPRGRGL